MKVPIIIILVFAFIANGLALPSAGAQEIVLPKPGIRVALSPAFNPPVLKGIKVHPDNPFRFDFILDKGDEELGTAPNFSFDGSNEKLGAVPNSSEALKNEANKLIKYFLASLTVPEKDLWVNLSPYEKDRIVPPSFGLTEMGRDLLAQDYLLKQITASLIYPEDEFGKKFWNRIYEEAAKKFGTTNIPVNTFNKVWIVPEKAVVYENAQAGTAYVVESKLKVMLEQDYLALEQNSLPLVGRVREGGNELGSQIVREVVIPQLTKEVNENKNFAQLRQVYNSLILATWYKKKIKDSILNKVYADRNKINGLSFPKSSIGNPETIYQQYLTAFKKGVYNYIKEEQDPITQQMIPRKYFSGGVVMQFGSSAGTAMVTVHNVDFAQLVDGKNLMRVSIALRDAAMVSRATPTDFEELNAVLTSIGVLEQQYIQSLREVHQIHNPTQLVLLQEKIKEDHKALMKKVNHYLRSRTLKGTIAQRVFQRYAQEIRQEHDSVLDVLSVYIDWRWPQSRPKDAAYDANFQRARNVWEHWEFGRDPRKRELVSLRLKQIQISDNTREGRDQKRKMDEETIEPALREIINREVSAVAMHLNDYFKVLSYTETLMAQVHRRELRTKQAEQFFRNFAFTVDELKELEQQGNAFIAGADQRTLFASMAKGLVSSRQFEEIRDIMAKAWGPVLRRDRKNTVFKRRFALTAAAVALSVIASGKHNATPHADLDAHSDTQKTVSAEVPQQKTLTAEQAINILTVSKTTLPERVKDSERVLAEKRKEILTKIAAIEKSVKENEKAIEDIDLEVKASLWPVDEIGGRKEEARAPEFDLPKPQWHQPSSKEKLVGIDIPRIPIPVSLNGFIPSQIQAFLAQRQGVALQPTKVTQGVPIQMQEALLNMFVAEVSSSGFQYLSSGSYSRFNPLTGEMFPQPPDVRRWALTDEATNDFVIMPTAGQTQLPLLVPPGYKVVNVQTQNTVSAVNVFYDHNNKRWSLVVVGNAGLVRLGVARASEVELGTTPPLQIVDSNNQPLNRQEFLSQMKKDMPAELWDFFERNKNRPLEERKALRDGLVKLRWFYYTENPLLASSSLLKSIYDHMALKCDGFAIEAMINSVMLGLDDVAEQVGFFVEQPIIIGSYSHQWPVIAGQSFESTEYSAELSALYERSGVTTAEFQVEEEFLRDRWAPSRRAMMPLDLQNLEKGLEKGQLEKELQNTTADPEHVEAQQRARIEAYYLSLMDDYGAKLNALKSQPMDEAAAQAIKSQLRAMDLGRLASGDQYQFMAVSHFINGVLALLEQRGFQDEQIKSEMLGRLKNIVWDPDKLIEPLPDSSGRLMNTPSTRVMIRDNRYIIDVLTNEVTEVPDIDRVEDFIDGLYIVRQKNGNKVIAGRKAGKYAGTVLDDHSFILHLPYSGNDWIIVQESSPADNESPTTHIGPVIEKELGRASLIFESVTKGSYYDMNVNMIKGDIMIKEGKYGHVHYWGRLAQKIGVEGKTFKQGGVFIKLPNGNVVLPAQAEDGLWRFYGNGVPDNLKAQTFAEISSDSRTYPDGRWMYRVHFIDPQFGYLWGYAGDIRDDDISTMRGTLLQFQKFPFMSPDHRLGWVDAKDHLVRRNMGQWFTDDPNNQEKQMLTNDPVFFDATGKTWVGYYDNSYTVNPRWVGSDPLIQTYHLDVPIEGDRPNGTQRRIDKIGKVLFELNQFEVGRNSRGPGAGERWIASADSSYGGGRLIGPLADADPYVQEGRVKRVDKYQVISGSQWYAVVNGNVLIGNWARENHLTDDPRLKAASQIEDVIFFKGWFGRPDIYSFMIIYKDQDGSKKALGPIADALGISGKSFEILSSTFGGMWEDYVTLRVKEKNGITKQVVFPPSTHNFSERSAALWGLGSLDGISQSLVVDNIHRKGAVTWIESIDLLLRNMDAFMAKNPMEKEFAECARLLREHDLRGIEKVLTGSLTYQRFTQELYWINEAIAQLAPAGPYFNPGQIEAMIRRHKTFLARMFVYTLAAGEGKSNLDLGNLLALDVRSPLLNFSLDRSSLEMLMEVDKNLKDYLRLPAQPFFNPDVIDDYDHNAQLALPVDIRGALLSPLRVEMSDENKKINAVVKSVLTPTEQLLVQRYETTVGNAAAYLDRVSPGYRKGTRDLSGALRLLHQRTGMDFPFDVEMAQTHNPVYAEGRLVMGNADLFKTGFEARADIRQKNEQWHTVNDQLNQISSVAWPQGQFSMSSLIQTFSHDTLAMALFLGIIFYFLSKKSDTFRQQDKDYLPFSRASAEEKFEHMWNENPWFQGEGWGNIPAAKELTRRILFEGISEEEREELQRMRPQWNEQENAIVDAVLALAVDSPQEAVRSAQQRLIYLVPFIGLGLIRDPQAYRKRQQMNRELEEAVKNPSPDLLNRIRAIVDRYAVQDDDRGSPQRQEQGLLSFDVFAQEMRRWMMDINPVRTDGREIFSPRHDGSVAPGLGQGGDFAEHRLYVPGDDLRKVSIREHGSGQLLVKAYHPDREVDAGIFINMAGLITPQATANAAVDLVNSIKVLFQKTSQRNLDRGNFRLTGIRVLMPDGTIAPLSIGTNKQDNFVSLSEKVLSGIQALYEQASNEIAIQQSQAQAPSFYNQRERQKYTDVNALGLSRFQSPLLHPSETLQRQMANLGRQNIFLVGFNPGEGKQAAFLLPRARVYSWNGTGAALHVPASARGDAAMGAARDLKGGIDFNAEKVDSAFEVKNDPREKLGTRNEYMSPFFDPAMLEQLQNSPGFMPVIINIQPMNDLKGFLGLIEDSATPAAV